MSGVELTDDELKAVYERLFGSDDGVVVLLDLIGRYGVMSEYDAESNDSALVWSAVQRPVLYMLRQSNYADLATMSALAKLAKDKTNGRRRDADGTDGECTAIGYSTDAAGHDGTGSGGSNDNHDCRTR